MVTIRSGIFETNSSSMHAITFAKDSFYDSVRTGESTEYGYPAYKSVVKDNYDKTKAVIIDLAQDFSSRTYIPHFDAESKGNYVGLLFVNEARRILNDSVKPTFTRIKDETGKVIGTKKKRVKPWTKEEMDLKNEQLQRFITWLTDMFDYMNTFIKSFNFVEGQAVIPKFASRFYLEFDNRDHSVSLLDRNLGWYSNGCYGHDGFIGGRINIKGLFESMERFMKSDAEKPEPNSYYFGCVFNFMFNTHSAILQGGDEMDDSLYEAQQKEVVNLVTKTGGNIEVYWPIGG